MRKARLVALAAVVAAAGAIPLAVLGFGGGGDGGEYLGSTPPEGLSLPAFALEDVDGEPVSSDDLGGKVVLVTFLDTQCRESCPVIASAVALGLDRLEAQEREDVVALAITVDPAGDTPESVREFLARHRAEDSLRYLVGTEEELRPAWEAFGVLPSVDTGDDDLHSAPLRIYEGDGTWATTLHAGVDLTPENLAHDVRVALAG